jgi:2-hydroxychromene-2-carboxylate isomerase
MGLDYQNIIAEASEASIIASYEANTDAAQAIGVFGAPSFSVGDEIFWGDDRLEDAIRHAGNG